MRANKKRTKSLRVLFDNYCKTCKKQNCEICATLGEAIKGELKY